MIRRPKNSLITSLCVLAALRTWYFGFVHQVLTYSRRDNESTLAEIHPFDLERFTRFAEIIAHAGNFLADDEYRFCLKDAERKYFSFSGCLPYKAKIQSFGSFTGKAWPRSMTLSISRL